MYVCMLKKECMKNTCAHSFVNMYMKLFFKHDDVTVKPCFQWNVLPTDKKYFRLKTVFHCNIAIVLEQKNEQKTVLNFVAFIYCVFTN